MHDFLKYDSFICNLFSVSVTPLDVVKIRLQIQQKTTIDKFLCCTSLMDRYCNCHPYTFKNMYWYPNKHNLDGTLVSTASNFKIMFFICASKQM